MGSRKAEGFVGRGAMTQRLRPCHERQVEKCEVHGDEVTEEGAKRFGVKGEKAPLNARFFHAV
jgi:hypothetical protein